MISDMRCDIKIILDINYRDLEIPNILIFFYKLVFVILKFNILYYIELMLIWRFKSKKYIPFYENFEIKLRSYILSKSLIEITDIKSHEKKNDRSLKSFSRISAYLFIDFKKLINYPSREWENSKPIYPSPYTFLYFYKIFG